MRDPRAAPTWWLQHYFPATARLEASRETPLGQVAQMLGGRLDMIPVPIPADCTDGFNVAYWRLPGAYLDPRPGSHVGSGVDPNAGMRRLRADLSGGEWDRRWGHLRTLDEPDLGYRVLAAHS
jgi:hypothetical protein